MIVRDGADDLQACLACVSGWFAQTVVVDTGSTDTTVAVASAAGADVHHFPWCDDFSAARNTAIGYATQPWILILDADERLDHAAHAALVQCLATSADAYVVPYRSYTNHVTGGDWVPNDGSAPEGAGWAGWVPGRVVRLFRNGRGFRFSGLVHETLDESLFAVQAHIADADFCIHHLQERHGWEHVAAKQRRYLRLTENEIREGRGTAKHYTNLAIMRREFCNGAADAAAALQQALRLDPGYRPAWRELLATYLMLRQMSAARELAEEMRTRWPDDPLPLRALGTVAQQAGDLAAAAAALAHAVRLAPHDVRAAVQWATVRMQQGAVAEVRPVLENLHRRHPSHVGVLRQLSAVYAVLGLGQDAAVQMDRAVAAVPPDVSLWNNLGVIRAQTGDRAGAAEAFRRVLALEPSHTDAQRNLAALEHAG